MFFLCVFLLLSSSLCICIAILSTKYRYRSYPLKPVLIIDCRRARADATHLAQGNNPAKSGEAKIRCEDH